MWGLVFLDKIPLILGPTTFAAESGTFSQAGAYRATTSPTSWTVGPVLLPLRKSPPSFIVDYEWSYPASAPNEVRLFHTLDTLPINPSGLSTTAPGLSTPTRFDSLTRNYRDAISYVADWSGGLMWQGTRGTVTRNDVMPGSKMYYTFAPPKADAGAVTEKRVGWLVNTTNGAKTNEEAADKIHAAIGGNDTATVDAVPYHPGRGRPRLEPGASWELLDGTVSGECDEHALLMARAMRMLGVDATVNLIRASTDANLLDVELVRMEDGTIKYLIMDFSEEGEAHDPNAFEAVCETDGRVYAVWPAVKGQDRLDLYLSLPFRQWWVRTTDDTVPGEANPQTGRYWAPVVEWIQEVPKFGATGN